MAGGWRLPGSATAALGARCAGRALCLCGAGHDTLCRAAPLAQALEEASGGAGQAQGQAQGQARAQAQAAEEGPAHALYQQLVDLGLLRR